MNRFVKPNVWGLVFLTVIACNDSVHAMLATTVAFAQPTKKLRGRGAKAPLLGSATHGASDDMHIPASSAPSALALDHTDGGLGVELSAVTWAEPPVARAQPQVAHATAFPLVMAVSLADAGAVDVKEIADGVGKLVIDSKTDEHARGYAVWLAGETKSVKAIDQAIDEADLGLLVSYCCIDDTYDLSRLERKVYCGTEVPFWRTFRKLLMTNLRISETEYALVYAILHTMGTYHGKKFAEFIVGFAKDAKKVVPDIHRLSPELIMYIKRCMLLRLFTLNRSFSVINGAPVFDKASDHVGFPVHIATRYNCCLLVHFLLSNNMFWVNCMDKQERTPLFLVQSKQMIDVLGLYGANFEYTTKDDECAHEAWPAELQHEIHPEIYPKEGTKPKDKCVIL